MPTIEENDAIHNNTPPPIEYHSKKQVSKGKSWWKLVRETRDTSRDASAVTMPLQQPPNTSLQMQH